MSILSNFIKKQIVAQILVSLFGDAVLAQKRAKYKEAVLARAQRDGVAISEPAAELAVNETMNCVKHDLGG